MSGRLGFRFAVSSNGTNESDGAALGIEVGRFQDNNYGTIGQEKRALPANAAIQERSLCGRQQGRFREQLLWP